MTERKEGRIVRSLSGFYDVQTKDALITCRARGILRKEGNSPLTGDMVQITVERGKGMVEKILPRKNSFIRPAVANMDALVVFAANVNPVTEPFLIDRVAAIAGDQEVPVYLCVNKCDLDPALDLVAIYEKAGFPVICTSAETGEGVEALRELIRGKLVAFTGNSGVGKSSILNRLAPELNLATGEVSEKLGRGRHTTRHVELYRLGEDTYVADTPGFSSFDTDQMDVILKENLQYAFPDFGPHIGKCRFDDCSHRKEPDCAVRAAFEAGEIGRSRYDSYLKLYEKASQINLWELKK
ncbi:MAG: ribosome small subunit-dependent GTPase A [Oscillospiraceae bacterium]|nr:ribosome small subunit-dependent GTPase A [Oscillospiraceae bacterium]